MPAPDPGSGRVRMATWNLERKRPTIPTGRAAVEHLRSLEADVLVLTEARLSYPADDGHVVSSRSLGSEDERKVVMWSRRPWTDVDDVGSRDLPPGRFVAAKTETSLGEVRVMGVCISWHMANVQWGDRNKKPWEDHITYCRVLHELIADHDPMMPLVVAGDFNQTIPPRRPESDHGRAIAAAFDRMDVVTAGGVSGWEKPGIDHIAVVGVQADKVWGWPKDVGGAKCSDHSGAAADLRKAR